MSISPAKCRQISLIVYDFDGVLTDNRVWVSERGEETVACNRSDGWWISEIKTMGIDQIILSTEKNPVVSARASKIGLECIQGTTDKLGSLMAFIQKKNIRLESVCYVGNEMNDLECMKAVGYPGCPSDSHPEIIRIARIRLPEKGGHGIVRHLFDWLQAHTG